MKIGAASWECSVFAGEGPYAHFLTIDNVAAVYRIIHKESGRFYVGSTVNARSRLKRHFYDLQAGTHHSPFLQRAWLKYGPAEFRFEVVEYVADRAWILFHEQAYIDTFRGKDVLFNTCMQAGNCTGVKHDAETIERRAAKLRGRVVSAETRLAISAAKRGRCSEAVRKAVAASSLLRRINLSREQLQFVRSERQAGHSWESIASQLGMTVKPLRREVRRLLGTDTLMTPARTLRVGFSPVRMWLWVSGNA